MRPYVTTLLGDTQRLINGFADIGTKDDGGQSNESFIMMVMNGDVQGVTVFLTSPHMHDDALSVTSDGYDCIMLSVLLGDVELLHALLRAISEAHADMSRHSADLTKQYARAIEGANINMLMFPPLLRLPLRLNLAGQSALHIAVVWQDEACVQLLLRCVTLPHTSTRLCGVLMWRALQVRAARLGRGCPPAGCYGAYSFAVCNHEPPRRRLRCWVTGCRYQQRVE